MQWISAVITYLVVFVQTAVTKDSIPDRENTTQIFFTSK